MRAREMNTEDVDRKLVVVTGASAAVGRAVVREFSKQGAHIGLIARGKERLESGSITG